MSLSTTINITNPQSTMLYGAYQDAGWHQATAASPVTGVAVLEKYVETAGNYICTIYTEDETFTPPDTELEYKVEFGPDDPIPYSGTLTTDSDATAEDTAAVTGEGYVITDTETVTPESPVDVYLSTDFEIEVDTSAHDLKSADDFVTLIYTLLFTDGRASKYRAENDRRGWIGDIENNEFVSLVWMKDQAKLTRIDMNELESFAKTALNYMVRKKICQNVAVDATENNNNVGLDITVSAGNDVLKIYVPIWRGEA